MKILLLGATLDSENMGVRALTAGAIKCILSDYPGAEIALLDYSKQPSMHTLRLEHREISVPLVNLRFSWRFWLRANVGLLFIVVTLANLIPSRRFRQNLLMRNARLRKILDADLIASVAGGDSFSDIYGLIRLIYVSLPQILVLALDKPLTFLPQTIGPFNSRLGCFIARFILRRAERVCSRDREGELEVIRLFEPLPEVAASHPAITISYDIGFAVDPIAPPHIEMDGLSLEDLYAGNLVGFNVSGLLWMGGYNRQNMFGLTAGYDEIVLAVLNCLIEEKKQKILLVPHVFGSDAESDSVASTRLFDSCQASHRGRIGILRGSYDQSEIKYIIGHCDFFVGSRMHACIAALSQGVPAVPIAYSRKFSGVMETIGCESLVADARQMRIDQICRLIGDAYERRVDLRERIRKEMISVKASQRHLFQNSPKSEKGRRTRTETGRHSFTSQRNRGEESKNVIL